MSEPRIDQAMYMRMVAQWVGHGKTQAEAELAVDEEVFLEDRSRIEELIERYAGCLIDIAALTGPREFFPAHGHGQRETPAYDPVADFQSPAPRDFRRASAYRDAARGLGIL